MKDMLAGPPPAPDDWEAIDAEVADHIAELPVERQPIALARARLSRKVAEALWEQCKMSCRKSMCLNSRATPRDAMSCAVNIMQMMQCNLVHAVRISDWGEAFRVAIRTLSIQNPEIETSLGVAIAEGLNHRKRHAVKKRPVKRRRK